MYRNLKAVRSIAVFHSRNMPPNSALYPRLFFLAALGGSAKKTLRGIASEPSKREAVQAQGLALRAWGFQLRT
jgi:hypothetical protein